MAALDHLWAPWRHAYLSSTRRPNAGCVLCQALRSRHDRRSYLLYRGPTTFVIFNRYPYNSGHLMVAVNRHCGELSQLPHEELAELWETTAKMVKILERHLRPHGVNVGLNIGRAAGAGLPDHLHVHIVPRWFGDTNAITTVSGMRVVSASMDALYRRLKPLMPNQTPARPPARKGSRA